MAVGKVAGTGPAQVFPGHSVQLLSLTGPHVSLSQPAPLPAAGMQSLCLDGGCRVLLPCRKAG